MKFCGKIRVTKKTAVFIYYSGHGLLVDGFTDGVTISGQEFPLEEKIRKLSLYPNSLVMSLLDCCREIPAKNVKGNMQQTVGQLHLLHAVGPGKAATTRPELDYLSEFTAEFLQKMKQALDPYPTCLKSWLRYHKKAECLDKMQFEFCLKLDTKPVEPVFVMPKQSFQDWAPEDIADWFKTLKLSKDYTHTILTDRIDGEGVCLLIDTQCWSEYGILAKMDQSKIKTGVSKVLMWAKNCRNPISWIKSSNVIHLEIYEYIFGIEWLTGSIMYIAQHLCNFHYFFESGQLI